MTRALTGLLLLILFGPGAARAHEVRTAFLAVTEGAEGLLHIRFRQPIIDSGENWVTGLNLRAAFSPACGLSGEARQSREDGYLTRRYDVRCPIAAQQRDVTISGLRRTMTDVYVSYTDADGALRRTLLNASRDTLNLASEPSRGVSAYLSIGVRHMLGGLDHVLFVIGLTLLVRRPPRLISVATAFTMAHSVTLALTVLDLLRLPSAPVEAGIALSVVFLACELTREQPARDTLVPRYPEIVAFAFGLLHGCGFAGALAAIGLPQAELALALLLFNLGVELGQVAVIAGMLFVAARIGKAALARSILATQCLLVSAAAYCFTGALRSLF